MIEKCSSVTSFIHIFWKNSSHALVDAKLPNCNPANVRIDLHISYIYCTDIVLLIKVIALIYNSFNLF